MAARERGLTLIEVMVVLLVLDVLTTFLISATARASRLDRLTECRDHLKQLHSAQESYYAGRSPDLSLRGDSLWNMLTDATPPLLDAAAIRCPVREAKTPYACHYLGPGMDVTKMPDDGFLACDDPSNHATKRPQGGHVLRKSGDVVLDRRGIWKAAISSERKCAR